MKSLIFILIATILTIFISGCSQKACEDYYYTECPDRCQLCGDNVWSSTLECKTKEYCQNTIECITHSIDNCTGKCIVCPPCAECSSLSCQSEEFCESIGFNRHWYEEIQNRRISIVNRTFRQQII